MFQHIWDTTFVEQCIECDVWEDTFDPHAQGPNEPEYHDPPEPLNVGYAFGTDGSNLVHNVMGGLSGALALRS